jgi:hypothetical protein
MLMMQIPFGQFLYILKNANLVCFRFKLSPRSRSGIQNNGPACDLSNHLDKRIIKLHYLRIIQ